MIMSRVSLRKYSDRLIMGWLEEEEERIIMVGLLTRRGQSSDNIVGYCKQSGFCIYIHIS